MSSPSPRLLPVLVALLSAAFVAFLAPSAEARKPKGPTPEQVLAAREVAETALALDFRQSDRLVVPAEVVTQYEAACAAGYAPICGWRTWHHGHDTIDIKAAAAHFAPLCEAKDPLACVVVGWQKSQSKPGRLWMGGPDPTGAAEHFSQACQLQFGRGCYDLGRLYEAGHGLPVEPATAADLYARACGLGFERGCAAGGELRLLGVGVPRDVPGALQDFAAACEGGSALGCASQARARRLGLDPAPVDDAATVRLLEDRCKWGSQSSCAELGMWLAAGRGAARDAARATTLFQRACESGEMRGCFNLGGAFLKGEGVVGNSVQGRARWSQACDGGLLEACYQLASFHTHAGGTPEDLANGLRLLERGCGSGHQPSCGALGERLLEGPESEHLRAVGLLKGACAADSDEACVALARAYAEGRGGERDLPRAIQILEPRCKVPGSQACFSLAVHYFGPSSRQGSDAARAVRLWSEACEAGRADACGRAAEALQHGTHLPADAARARGLAERGCAALEAASCGVLALQGARAELSEARVAEVARVACDRGHADGCRVWVETRERALPPLPPPPPVKRGAPPPPPAPDRVLASLREGCELQRKGAECATLGALHWVGVRATLDPAAARALFERACTSRDAVACGNVGLMAQAGEGGRVDFDQALVMLRAACQGGDTRSCERLKGAVNLTP